MNFPKIVFKAMDIEDNIGFVKWCFYQGNGDLSVHDYTIKKFPELIRDDSPTHRVGGIVLDSFKILS